jgi:hypothetical protein
MRRWRSKSPRPTDQGLCGTTYLAEQLGGFPPADAVVFKEKLRARFPPGANQEVPSLCRLDTFHCNIVAECPTQGLRKDGIAGPIP